ncbi:TPA: M66 family metalloprotease [Providencia rettgeri]
MDNNRKQPRIAIPRVQPNQNRGRIAVIDADSPLLTALKENPTTTKESEASYHFFSWLIDKPRMQGDDKPHFILSTLPTSEFSGFDFHAKQGLFIESFDSYHEWKDGEPRAQNQLADLLLPSGQWHRHYNVVVLPENANDTQVKLIRHWMELTGGSLLIIKNKNKPTSPSIKKLIDEIPPIQPIESQSLFLDNQPLKQTIHLPLHAVNQLKLTDNLRKNVQYFSIEMKSVSHDAPLTIHNAPINVTSSWQSIAYSIETQINQLLTKHALPLIRISYENNTLKLIGNEIIFNQFQLKQAKKIRPTDSEFKRSEQIFPILVTENPDEIPNQMTVGAITGKLLDNKHIQQYKVLEPPKFGHIEINQYTHEWRYTADKSLLENQSDQFDLVAIMDNGQLSSPISIQLQTEIAPQVIIPGKRTFSIPDPIYYAPQARHHPKPSDIRVHNVQLAQTHLQRITDEYSSLTANRWALLKLDITSKSKANSPDIEAVVCDKERKILGRVRLTGPETLPSHLTQLPNIPNVTATDWHQKSFTAPLKAEWMQPDIKIIIFADNKPIITKDSDKYGAFSPKVTLDSHLNVHIDNFSLHRQGQGIYADSPLSWGLEATAILPISHLTLSSTPASHLYPSLMPYWKNNNFAISLFHPRYDAPEITKYQANSQINWANINSQQYYRANHVDSNYHYTAISHQSMTDNTLLGLAAPHHGGGVHRPNILFHEIFGHGFGLPHTTQQSNQTRQGYPYNANSHGPNPAYNQYRQHYITYKYLNRDKPQQLSPTMFPYSPFFTSNLQDAFLPHADYNNMKIHHFLSNKIRWKPNKIKGVDIEDDNFAGEGFYQRWDKDTKKWVTLNQQNYTQYYNQTQIQQLPHQRDVPIYWVHGELTTLADGTPHPYNTMAISRTIGNLPADYHNLKTGHGRQYSPYHSHALTVVYDTSNGLLTDVLQVDIAPYSISLNIADKGEIVKFTLQTLTAEKTLGNIIYQYTNPTSLASRVFHNSIDNKLPNQLILDNYWQGSPIFWAATDENLIDFASGMINIEKIAPESAVMARWVENGRLQQRYFALADPFGNTTSTIENQHFTPLNHLDSQSRRHLPDFHINIPSEQLLIADMNIKQQIDISGLNLSEGQYHYWVTLIIHDSNGLPKKVQPLEKWYFSKQGHQLTVQGTINSTPELTLEGIQIHIDQHLNDNVAPSSIWLYQNKVGQLAENTEFLNYDRPVEFNSIINRPELLSSMPETQTYSHRPTPYPNIPPIEHISSPLIV